MRLKQKLSATLAVLLILLHGFPAFAIAADELQEQTETVTIQDSGTLSEPSDTDKPQESEHPDTDSGATELGKPEENNATVDTPAIQPPSDAQPPAAPIIELPEQREAPVFSIEPMVGGENPGLYGTLDYIPDTPPTFSAKIELIMGGYALKGSFTDFLSNTAQVRPMYSLNGEIYEPIGVDGMSRDWDLSFLGSENPKEQARLQNQVCAYSRDEPMNSYLKHGLERFYIKLQITTETGETYDTEAAVIDRCIPQPPPENKVVSAIFPASMRAVDKGETPPFAYGKYQITVREDATAEDVYMLLPDTLPIEVRITDPDTGVPITTGIVECEVNWKEIPQLNLTAGKAFTIRDAANELVVPAGTEVSTPLGIYVLPEAIGLNGSEASDEVRIVINAIGAEEQPDISLAGSMNDDTGHDKLPLSLAFRLKPSGATSVKAYSYMEGNGDWTEICEMLSFRDINANQSAEMYGYVDVLQPGESPYTEYLNGEITGFLIGVIIEGGTFDGERVILPWPGKYTPPTRIPEFDGSGGNEGNAGSGDGSGDSAEGGQRPDLPDDGAPPVTEPPVGTSNPPDGSGTPPSTPAPPEPPVPSLPDGNTTTNPPTDTTGDGESTVSPEPPDNPDALLPTEPKYPAEHPPMTVQGNTFVADNKPDNKVKPQEQTQERSDAQAVPRQASNTEKTRGLPVTAAVLLLGGGITAVAVAGAGSTADGMAGTSAVSKLLTALKKFFRHP